ncbi:MAG: hypothetical protein R3B54_10085 [Bdellovibrionota bacterium]
MFKLNFFPLGNADCYRIDLCETGKKILIDYAHCKSGEDGEDCRVDLAKELRHDLAAADRQDYDVVAFTHADTDHVRGAADFFYFDHAAAYQSEDRIKIRELWVPAAMIIEEGLDGDDRVIRQEARHRLRRGYGIRVFSRPELLREWLEKEGLSVEARRHLITDAGNLVPGFSLGTDGLEFFVHSPFAHRDGDVLQDRNSGSLFFQATFCVEGVQTRFILGADTPHECLSEIVQISKYHGNEIRLQWDVLKLPHHCSYLSLSDEKGKEETIPVPEVAWLLEQGQQGGIIVSTSDPINSIETVQPPHFQAANAYRRCARKIGGEFLVTMEHPTRKAPRSLVIRIDVSGATVQKDLNIGAVGVITRPHRERARDGCELL